MNPISLASGIVPGATPVETIHAAVAGRFDYVGLWVVPGEFTPDVLRETKAALADTGMPVLDAEVIILEPGDVNPDHLTFIDIAAELGAKHVLAISRDPDMSATAAKMRALCEHAEGTNVGVSLEFMRFTEIKSLNMALGVIDAVDHPKAALLIDPLHVHRSGASPEDLDAVSPSLLPYAQFCDGVLPGPDPMDTKALFDDAVDGRAQMGEGGLPLADIFKRLPKDIPLSIELRSKALRDGWPDYGARAKVTAEKTRAWLKAQAALASL